MNTENVSNIQLLTLLQVGRNKLRHFKHGDLFFAVEYSLQLRVGINVALIGFVLQLIRLDVVPDLFCDFGTPLWKSIKYEEVYLRAYETVSAARSGIARYIDFYNNCRPHSSLDGITPDAFYFKHLPAMQSAA